MEGRKPFTWVAFYMEFADRLRFYEKERGRLIEKIKAVYNVAGMSLPRLERDGHLVDIDPFTVFGLFNRGLSITNRVSLIRAFAEEFGVKAAVPLQFDGVPVLNNQRVAFYHFLGERGEQDIDNLWQVFLAALDYAQVCSRDPIEEWMDTLILGKNSKEQTARKALAHWYDIVMQQKGIKWNLTIGLFWVRPYIYLNLDSRTRWFITNFENIPKDWREDVGNLETVPSGEGYLSLIDSGFYQIQQSGLPYSSFPELSHCAWRASKAAGRHIEAEQQNSEEDVMADRDAKAVRYWLYSPGEGASRWDAFYQKSMMAIGWGEIGDLRSFESKDEMKLAMKRCFEPTLTYKNAAHATWQFANEMKPGDIVFAKKGRQGIVGRGVVASDYAYDTAQPDDFWHTRRVNWTHRGE